MRLFENKLLEPLRSTRPASLALWPQNGRHRQLAFVFAGARDVRKHARRQPTLCTFTTAPLTFRTPRDASGALARPNKTWCGAPCRARRLAVAERVAGAGEDSRLHLRPEKTGPHLEMTSMSAKLCRAGPPAALLLLPPTLGHTPGRKKGGQRRRGGGQ